MILKENNLYEAGDMSDAGKVISAFTVFKFIKIISDPFTKMEAYKLGIIDAKGNFLKKVEELKTSKEMNAASPFNRLMINLKKIIQKVPDPRLKSMLRTLPTAMILLKDEAEKIGANGEVVLSEMIEYLKENGIQIKPITINEEFENFIRKNQNVTE